MGQQLKRWLWPRPREPEAELTWHDPGPDNPFGVRFLDCHAVTWNLVATSVDRTIAEEVKWDIYIYNSVFLFARSWTGDLCYRAVAEVGPTEMRIGEIECSRSDTELAAAHVYFLIGTHAMGRVLPRRVPANTPRDPGAIATLSFALFGRFGCYATFEDITAIPIQDGARLTAA